MSSDTAPALEGLEYVKGGPLDLAAGRGKKGFVIEFWATWCPPCRTSIPHISDMAQKYKDTIEIVGVTSENETAKVEAFVKKMGSKMDYHVAIDTKGLVSESYMGTYGVSGIPHSFIIDTDGKVTWHGHPMDPEFEKKLAEVSAKAAKGGDSPNSNSQNKLAHHYTLQQIAQMSEDELAHLSAKDLRGICQEHNVDVTACLEKSDYVQAIHQAIH